MKHLRTSDVVRLGLLWLTLFSSSSSRPLTPNDQYAIIFDAGSSKTKMEIYNIRVTNATLDTTDVIQLDLSPDKVRPGIASLADNPTDVEAYMKPLLDLAKKTVPVDKQPSTPIFLLATAGMRLLSEDKADAILNEVRKLFSNKTQCPFQFNHAENARVIPGKWEAIYSWITVNFLKEAFVSHASPETYGILDLGGASHENAKEISNNRSDMVSVFISGTEYDLLVRYYLGYGLDEARARYLRTMDNLTYCTRDPACQLKSPCHHVGYKESIMVNNVLKTVVGTANVRRCRSVIRREFFCQNPNSDKCAFHDQPQLNGSFYGFSGMFYVLRGIGALCDDCDDSIVTTKTVKQRSRSFCLKNYSEVNSDPYAKVNCFGANYIYELFKHGYRLSADQEITVTNKLNGFDLGWTLGAMLYNLHLL